MGARTRNSEVLLDALYPPEQLLEEFLLGWSPRLRSDGFKIMSNVFRCDPGWAVSDLGKLAGRSGRPTDEFGELFL